MRSLSGLGWLIGGMLVSGCMLAPTDDQRLDSTEAPIRFLGYVLEPSQPVYVEAYNRQTGQYEEVGRTTSSSSAYEYQGSDLFSWSMNLSLSDVHWRPGHRGRHAVLEGFTIHQGSEKSGSPAG